MASTTIRRDDATVFHYGFLASRTSEALEAVRTKAPQSALLFSALPAAVQMLQDIIQAQETAEPAYKGAAPSSAALGAFRCALEVIVVHRDEFGVKTPVDLANLFQTLFGTLQALSTAEHVKPSDQDLAVTERFFQQFARLMLAQLSVTPRFSEDPAIA